MVALAVARGIARGAAIAIAVVVAFAGAIARAIARASGVDRGATIAVAIAVGVAVGVGIARRVARAIASTIATAVVVAAGAGAVVVALAVAVAIAVVVAGAVAFIAIAIVASRDDSGASGTVARGALMARLVVSGPVASGAGRALAAGVDICRHRASSDRTGREGSRRCDSWDGDRHRFCAVVDIGARDKREIAGAQQQRERRGGSLNVHCDGEKRE